MPGTKDHGNFNINILESLHMQTAANIRTLSSGGSHSGKMSLTLYLANVRATMVMVQGLTIRHSAHNLTNPMKGPSESKM